mmetsp:Transcript_102754/g.317035  ORF Transcript_102754/g.317035 Transcript_102754/m.317035 type:complete len:213 (-) Transcript_102754:131-769(-)
MAEGQPWLPSPGASGCSGACEEGPRYIEVGGASPGLRRLVPGQGGGEEEGEEASPAASEADVPRLRDGQVHKLGRPAVPGQGHHARLAPRLLQSAGSAGPAGPVLRGRHPRRAAPEGPPPPAKACSRRRREPALPEAGLRGAPHEDRVWQGAHGPRRPAGHHGVSRKAGLCHAPAALGGLPAAGHAAAQGLRAQPVHAHFRCRLQGWRRCGH